MRKKREAIDNPKRKPTFKEFMTVVKENSRETTEDVIEKNNIIALNRKLSAQNEYLKGQNERLSAKIKEIREKNERLNNTCRSESNRANKLEREIDNLPAREKAPLDLDEVVYAIVRHKNGAVIHKCKVVKVGYKAEVLSRVVPTGEDKWRGGAYPISSIGKRLFKTRENAETVLNNLDGYNKPPED